MGFGPQAASFLGFASPSAAIPDFPSAGITSQIFASGLTGRLADLRVAVRVSHNFAGDLELHLVSPSGIRTKLISGFGGVRDGLGMNCPADDDDLIFALHATELMPATMSGQTPITGTVRGREGLGRYIGLTGADLNGFWSLEAKDIAADDTGVLLCWTLHLAEGACPGGSNGPCADERDFWVLE